jgi:putative salt-induced outer membrane protein YdiY
MVFCRQPARKAFAALACLTVVVVARPARCETLTIELRNGDVLTGEVIERNDEQIVLEHPVLGRLAIPVEQITPRSLHVGIAGTRFLQGWDKEVDIGVAGSEGDTDEADVIGGAALDYEDERKLWRLDARYALSYSENEIDDHNARATALRDWLFPGSRWLAFSYTAYDYDDFEAWEHRLTTGAGPGYRIIPKGPPFDLTLRTGPFLTYEFGDEDDARPEYGLGFFANWKINEGTELRAHEVYYQTLDELEFRNITGVELKLRLVAARGISLKLGVDNEYDSSSEDSKNNLKYRSTFSFDL